MGAALLAPTKARTAVAAGPQPAEGPSREQRHRVQPTARGRAAPRRAARPRRSHRRARPCRRGGEGRSGPGPSHRPGPGPCPALQAWAAARGRRAAGGDRLRIARRRGALSPQLPRHPATLRMRERLVSRAAAGGDGCCSGRERDSGWVPGAQAAARWARVRSELALLVETTCRIGRCCEQSGRRRVLSRMGIKGEFQQGPRDKKGGQRPGKDTDVKQIFVVSHTKKGFRLPHCYVVMSFAHYATTANENIV